MKKDNQDDDYKISLVWGLVFVALFFLLIIYSIWAVETGNYNTP